MNEYIQGLLLAFAMIIPIGPQNALVIMQGSKRQFYWMTPLICIVSDIILLILAVFAGGLFSQSPPLLTLLTLAGIAFLFFYGFFALRQALSKHLTSESIQSTRLSRKQIILMLLAVTWLNPAVYLDTIVILGSVSSQRIGIDRWYFMFGAMSASVIWFLSLSLLSLYCARWLERPISQRIINLVVAIIMWGLAIQLIGNLIETLS